MTRGDGKVAGPGDVLHSAPNADSSEFHDHRGCSQRERGRAPLTHRLCPRVVRPGGSPRTPSTFPTHTILNLAGSEGTVFVWQEYALGTYVCMNTHRGDICNAVEQDKTPPPRPSKLTIGEHALGVLRNFLKYSKGVTRG